MKDKKIVGTIIIIIVVAGLSFFGGMKYSSSKTSASQLTNRAQNGLGQNGGGRLNGAPRGGANGGFVSGKVLSVDATSMTVSLGGNGGLAGTPSGSKIIFFSPTTKVEKTVDGLTSDVTIGKQVLITGIANSDGSVNATSIQIRPTSITNIPSLNNPVLPRQ